MNPRPVLYLAGPFGNLDPIHGIQRNILTASEIALEAWGKGWAVICPHKNTADFQFATGIPDETWTEGYLSIMLRCDAVLMLPGWINSPGAVKERRIALRRSMEVFYYEVGGVPPCMEKEEKQIWN